MSASDVVNNEQTSKWNIHQNPLLKPPFLGDVPAFFHYQRVGCMGQSTIPDQLLSSPAGTEVHTSDRSPHLIVCGRLLLKNEMVKCAGTKKLRRSIRIRGEQVDHRLNLAAFNEILWLVKIMIPKITPWGFPGMGGAPNWMVLM